MRADGQRGSRFLLARFRSRVGMTYGMARVCCPLDAKSDGVGSCGIPLLAKDARSGAPRPLVTADSSWQQVYQLYTQGQRVSQIASSLRLSVDAVNTYLGISGTTT
jgi:hypothetical protein